MRIDNGQRLPLVIDGVFKGVCGVNRGVLAFQPNLRGRNPLLARDGELDGKRVELGEVTAASNGAGFTAHYRVVG